MKVQTVCHTLSLSLALLFSPLTSTGQVKNAAEPAHGQLTLQVRSEKSSYIPGEPISLKFTVLNNGDAPIVLQRGRGRLARTVQGFYRPTG